MNAVQRRAEDRWPQAVEELAAVDPLGVSGLAVPEEFVTADPGAANERVAGLLAAHELTVLAGRAGFRARAAAGRVGSTMLLELGYGAAVRIRRPPQAGYAALLVPLAGSVEFGAPLHPAVARPYRAMAVFGQGEAIDTSWSPGARAFVIRVETEELAAVWRRLVPDAPESTPQLASGVATGAAGYAVYGAVQLLASAWRSYGASDRLPPSLARPLGEQLLTALLLGVPHSGSPVLRELAAPIPGRRVRDAVALVHAEDSAETTILDLAAALGVGVRVLELGFRRELGVTPSEFLRAARLRRAHEELQRADPAATTVSEVAAHWGFANHGRFARAYRARYGVLPSVTLHGD